MNTGEPMRLTDEERESPLGTFQRVYAYYHWLCGGGAPFDPDATVVEERDVYKALAFVQRRLEDDRLARLRLAESDDCDEIAWCPHCGAPEVRLRPGKTQPVCECQDGVTGDDAVRWAAKAVARMVEGPNAGWGIYGDWLASQFEGKPGQMRFRGTSEKALPRLASSADAAPGAEREADGMGCGCVPWAVDCRDCLERIAGCRNSEVEVKAVCLVCAEKTEHPERILWRSALENWGQHHPWCFRARFPNEPQAWCNCGLEHTLAHGPWGVPMGLEEQIAGLSEADKEKARRFAATLAAAPAASKDGASHD